MLCPRSGCAVQIAVLQLGNVLVGTPKGLETLAKLRLWGKILAVSHHGAAENRHGSAAVPVFESIASAANPSGVDIHRFLKALDSYKGYIC